MCWALSQRRRHKYRYERQDCLIWFSAETLASSFEVIRKKSRTIGNNIFLSTIQIKLSASQGSSKIFGMDPNSV